MIPSTQLSPRPSTRVTADKPSDRPDAGDALLSGAALVLEDNLIIAMDASEILVELGASAVHTARGVADALEVLVECEISFAMLDVHLGDESSLEVARHCVGRGIRTILATGYDGSGEATSGFPDLPVVRKPYTIEQVRAALNGTAG